MYKLCRLYKQSIKTYGWDNYLVLNQWTFYFIFNLL